MTEEIRVAKIMPHMWEEPCISGAHGSGAIFFAGCNLKCVYCQNREISHGQNGNTLSVGELAQKMLDLQAMGVHNINLVTPTHYGDKIREAIDLIRGRLKIPVVYNTSGYELESEIEKMAGYVDVFLTDIKYFDEVASQKYSCAPDYYKVAKSALYKMLKVAPRVELDGDGLIKKGVIVRHLVLPTLRRDSIKILEDLKKSIDISCIRLSLMSQYTPDFCPDSFKEIKRRVTTFEYESVVNRAMELGYDGYIQDISSASKIYTPNFNEGDLE